MTGMLAAAAAAAAGTVSEYNTDHPVVYQPKPPIRQDYDIAWMRIRVVYAVEQQLVAVNTHECMENLAKINRGALYGPHPARRQGGTEAP